MKGCLAVVGGIVLLIVLLFSGCTGFVIYKGHQASERHDVAMARLSASNTTYAFTPPEDDHLDAERFERWLEARRGSTGPFESLFAEASGLEKLGEDGEVGFFEAISAGIGAVKGITQAIIRAPGAVADSLDEQEMSFAEYNWTTEIVHATIERANEDGEEAATAMSDAIDALLEGVQATINEDEFDRDRLGDLADRIEEWNPENMALLATHADAIVSDATVLLVDALTVNLAEELPDAEPAADEEE